TRASRSRPFQPSMRSRACPHATAACAPRRGGRPRDRRRASRPRARTGPRPLRRARGSSPRTLRAAPRSARRSSRRSRVWRRSRSEQRIIAAVQRLDPDLVATDQHAAAALGLEALLGLHGDPVMLARHDVVEPLEAAQRGLAVALGLGSLPRIEREAERGLAEAAAWIRPRERGAVTLDRKAGCGEEIVDGL